MARADYFAAPRSDARNSADYRNNAKTRAGEIPGGVDFP